MADLLASVAEAAHEAALMAASRAGSDVGARDKPDGSPVCEVDTDVDAMLRARLLALLPGAGWLSEEKADSEGRLLRRQVWVVDPIDGTRDYLRGRPGWAVSVALVENGRPILAVLDAPLREERWSAIAAGGAWRNGVRLSAGGRDILPGSRVPSDALPRADRDLTMVAKPNSIALRLAMVAADEADMVATLRWGNEWDIAAAALIVAEAGGVVTDAMGATLVYNKPRPQALGVLATTRGIHAAAVERLAPRTRKLLNR